ncbi:LysM peptidoglycan-binding domain-containing protein [Shewanella sp. WXL01]|uniref:LysM peptidoglycan-binding domain-containing protein n=1 Tax=Shewanella maritima TaxID=2520507 RepID=A0A411PHR2_9GAMM|nr:MULTISPECIES: LysM peptidoglycan-binding domain-containing protein [Shewanella]NKF51842.1 LysM peptidoglycan-binding domain-containing protein [Shewanella sp. WXL01]QBF83075.1 LysM peptidoglycan-binding domain-containing protein [Shewanella maritima]
MDLCMRRLLFLAFLALNITQVNADTLTLKAGHPDTYVVKKGDTLWDISGYFLNDPWRWPKLWGVNPQIANPHLIYPGDRLTLVFIDGEPRLVVKKHVKKNVEGRISPKGGAIPAVDLSLIHQYLNQNRVVEQQWLDGLPMVLSGENPSRHHLMDNIVYINANMPKGQKVLIYEPAREFTEAESGEPLGREIIVSASGRVVESGDVSKVQLLSNLRETKVGFKVARVEDEALLPAYFMPQAAETEGARVLATVGSVREAGKLDVVYLDKGSVDGVRPGHVFSMYRDGEEIIIDNDGMPVRVVDRSSYEKVLAHFSEDSVTKMPDIFHGNLMVFKVFDRTAMGLIMYNQRPVRVGDKLMEPVEIKLKAD